MFVGLEIAKDHLDTMTRPDAEHWSVPQTEAGWADLVARLRALTTLP